MSRLFNKLNVLMKSRLNSLIGDDSPVSPRKKDVPPQPGKELDRQIAMLREQIESAQNRDDRISAELDAMQREIAGWDQQADAALQRGDGVEARRLVRQIQLAQRQHAMLEADLAQHRDATFELLRQVNALEALAAQAEQQAAASDTRAEDDAASLSERLRKAREAASGKKSAPSASEPEQRDTVDDQAVEDDLAGRRQRLSL